MAKKFKFPENDGLIIDELIDRGYIVDSYKDLLDDVIWQYQRGNKKEALFQLERIVPELKGISS